MNGVLRPELAGAEVEIIGKQVSGERVVSYYVLIPGVKFSVKLPARLVEGVALDDSRVTCHTPSRVTVTNHVTKRSLRRMPRMF